VRLAILAAAEMLIAPDPFVDLSTGRLASEAGVSYTSVARGWHDLRRPIARLRALRLLDFVNAGRGEADDSMIEAWTLSLSEKLALERLDGGDLIDFLQALDQMIRERLEGMRQHSAVRGSALASTQWIVDRLVAPIVYRKLTGATDLPDSTVRIPLES
jgi:AcrR family transcriptional regulator